MKTNIKIAFLFCIFFTFGLSGCVSTGIPAPKSETETLVVVPVVVVDGRTTPFRGEIKYTVFMENIETEETVKIYLSTEDHGYSFVKRIPAGTYYITEYVTDGLSNDNRYEVGIDRYLVVKEGELTIFPGKLAVYIRNMDSDHERSYLYFWIKEINDDQIARIEDVLKADENYSLWE